jgi:acyl-CoA reductase-like NAD-dependent aldehyde dehydrogenase
MSTERVIVSPSLHDAFVKSIKEQHPKGKICKVVSPASAAKISGMVSSALKEGAKLVAGNDVWPPSEETLKKGEFPAIILDDIDRSMEIWREETFGPVAVIASSSALRSAITSDLKTSDAEDEAMVTFANDSDFGLAASIFSQDTARAMRVGRHLDIGMIRINSGTVADDAAVPFGGYKDTGFGRFNGVEALRAFTQTKAMTVPLHGAQMLPIH